MVLDPPAPVNGTPQACQGRLPGPDWL